MVNKYEVFVWTRKGYGDGAYHYLTMGATDKLVVALWVMFCSRKYNCVKLEVRR